MVLRRPAMNRSCNRENPDILIVMMAEKQLMRGDEDEKERETMGPRKPAREMSGTAPKKFSEVFVLFLQHPSELKGFKILWRERQEESENLNLSFLGLGGGWEKTKVTTVSGLLIMLFHGERETNDFKGNLWLLIIACLGCLREPTYSVNRCSTDHFVFCLQGMLVDVVSTGSVSSWVITIQHMQTRQGSLGAVVTATKEAPVRGVPHKCKERCVASESHLTCQ
ncbi:hypothetical protein SADUNF_Sadunf18G0041200 [Salix dunnii]|uniref:Uncharacterized protein n=1 Tax=Salix dunnii TaxID=1413687 RepID=A0A835J372_9ROSI|nr:hypothetical protein SADUNF_Sadunf18G0041200 [Salix dunnii]